MRLPARVPPDPSGELRAPSTHAAATDHHDHEALTEVLTIVRLAMASGARPRDAVVLAGSTGVGSLARDLSISAGRLDRGAPLTAALDLGGGDEHVRRLHRILIAAELDGSSGSAELDALQRDLRHARLTELEVGAHRLAVAVQFPVVLCVLPAFIVLALVPLALAVLGDLQL